PCTAAPTPRGRTRAPSRSPRRTPAPGRGAYAAGTPGRWRVRRWWLRSAAREEFSRPAPGIQNQLSERVRLTRPPIMPAPRLGRTPGVTQWVLHVDMDQFLASVEQLRHPELRGKPVVVGGDGDPTKRGVVSTASYEAREFGVHSGLPLRTAAKRLPDAVFLPVDREAYEEVSETVMAVLRSSGAAVEVMGWDEAFVGVDVEDPEAFARSLASRV